MYGNTWTRSRDAVSQGLRRPNHGARWLKDRIGGITSPIDCELPWMSWPFITYAQQHLHEGARVFEWGSGGSTLFWLNQGAAVTSVEHDPHWADRVLDAVAPEKRDKLEMRLWDINAPSGEEGYVDAVLQGGPWDIIVIDGHDRGRHSRIACARAIQPELLTAGGWVVLDDAWTPRYEQTIPGLLEPFNRRIFWGLGPCRWGMTRTDVYIFAENTSNMNLIKY